MLRRCQAKLNSRRGASFLLALLFFLVCALAASSVLMAAASNAGRGRSSREEHQTYLTISSAVQLLCDELNACQYQGQYRYWEEPIYGTGPEGEQIITGYNKYLEQLEGLYQYRAGGEAGMAELLLDDFDYIFSREFEGVSWVTAAYRRTGLAAPQEHVLTLRTQGAEGLDSRSVEVTLHVVEDSYAIELTARLKNQGDADTDPAGDYVVRAELTPNDTKPLITPTSTQGSYQSNAMLWRIGWIVPGSEAEEEAMPGA